MSRIGRDNPSEQAAMKPKEPEAPCKHVGKPFRLRNKHKSYRVCLACRYSSKSPGMGDGARRWGEKGKADRTRAGLHKAKETSINPYFSLETGSLGRIWVWKYSKPGMTSAWVTP